MIQWTSRICETCKHWIKDENECPYHGSLDRTDKYGNDMIVTDCTCYEEGEQNLKRMNIDIPERLHNCPNCGGTLQDDGKCRFCGSKVYDFLDFDLDHHTPTYVRMKYNGRIVHFKIIPTEFRMDIHCYDDSVLYMDNNPFITTHSPTWTGSLDFLINGNIIVEDKNETN